MNTLLRLLNNYRHFALIHLLIVLSLWAVVWIVSSRLPYYQEISKRHHQIKTYELGLDSKLSQLDSLQLHNKEQVRLAEPELFRFDLKQEDMLSWLRKDLLKHKLFLVAFNSEALASLNGKIDEPPKGLSDLTAHRGVLEVKGNFSDFLIWSHKLNQRRLPFFVKSFQANSLNDHSRSAKSNQWQNKVLVEWYAK